MNPQKGSFVVILLLIASLVILSLVFTRRYLVKTEANQFTPVYSPQPSPSPLPTPTPDPNDPTFSWTEYSNQSLGFTLKYPEKWLQPREHKLERRTEVNFNGVFTVTVGAFTDSSGKNLSFNEFHIQRQPSGASWEDITLDGRKGKRVIYKIGTSGKEGIYVFPKLSKPDQLIVFSTISHPYYINETKNIETILSTFKFLD